jgi:hypothetical protein
LGGKALIRALHEAPERQKLAFYEEIRVASGSDLSSHHLLKALRAAAHPRIRNIVCMPTPQFFSLNIKYGLRAGGLFALSLSTQRRIGRVGVNKQSFNVTRVKYAGSCFR